MGQTGQASDHHHRSSGGVCLFASCGSLLCCKHSFRHAAPDNGASDGVGLAADNELHAAGAARSLRLGLYDQDSGDGDWMEEHHHYGSSYQHRSRHCISLCVLPLECSDHTRLE